MASLLLLWPFPVQNNMFLEIQNQYLALKLTDQMDFILEGIGEKLFAEDACKTSRS